MTLAKLNNIGGCSEAGDILDNILDEVLAFIDLMEILEMKTNQSVKKIIYMEEGNMMNPTTSNMFGPDCKRKPDHVRNTVKDMLGQNYDGAGAGVVQLSREQE